MTSAIPEITGDMSLVTHRAIRLLSNLQASPARSIREYVANARDAQATLVTVVLRPDRVIVIDNGHGMVAGYTEDDQRIAREFEQQRENGTLAPGVELRDVVSAVSRKSLQWMMERVAESGKMPGPGENIQGMLAVGALAARSFAGKIEFITRPHPDLAQEYFGQMLRRVPTFRCIPPTNDELSRGIQKYRIGESPIPLKDAIGVEMSHGTRVEITQINPGSENRLRPALLEEEFSNAFSNALRNGLSIIIKSGTREIHVQPVQYTGIPLLNQRYHLPGGRLWFDVTAFYDTKGGRGRPMQLTRRGEEKRPIAELEGFNKPPFTSPKLQGRINYVELPSPGDPNPAGLPTEEQAWLTDKNTPSTATTVWTAWSRVIWDKVVPDIEAEIAKINERAQETRLQELARVVEESITTALDQLEPFQDVVLGGIERRKKGTRAGTSKRVNTRVFVTVCDEHGKGIPGVRVELRSPNGQPREIETKWSGRVSFGTNPYGRYTSRIIVPDGMSLAEGETPTKAFELWVNQPGVYISFHLLTGMPAPSHPSLRSVRVVPTPWGNPDEPYDAASLVPLGLLRMNTEGTQLRHAIDTGDEALQLQLKVLFTAMAVTQVAFPDETHEQQNFRTGSLFTHALGIASSTLRRGSGRKT